MKCKVKIVLKIVEELMIDTKWIDWKEASQKALEKINKKYWNKVLNSDVIHRTYL